MATAEVLVNLGRGNTKKKQKEKTKRRVWEKTNLSKPTLTEENCVRYPQKNKEGIN